jgi:hypothetical protein
MVAWLDFETPMESASHRPSTNDALLFSLTLTHAHANQPLDSIRLHSKSRKRTSHPDISLARPSLAL